MGPSQALWAAKRKGWTPWGLCGADSMRRGQGQGWGWPRNALSLWASVSSCPQPAARAGAASLRLGTVAHLHLYWRLLFLGPVGRRWPLRSAEQDAGEEGPTALSCQGHGKWPVGWACLAEEQWHRRFSGHKAGPDSLPVHPPRRLPTSAESWLCPTGLGERSEARASKGPGKAEHTLRATVCRPSSPPLHPGRCFSQENQGSEGLSSGSKVIGSLSSAPQTASQWHPGDTLSLWGTEELTPYYI